MDTMARLYEQKKEDAGLNVVDSHSDGSDFETEQVFKQLRPEATYKLMDILKGRVRDPEKQPAWKPDLSKNMYLRKNRQVGSLYQKQPPVLTQKQSERSADQQVEPLDPNKPTISSAVIEPMFIT